MLFGPIVSGITNLATAWIKGKQEKAKLKSQVELSKLEATRKKIETDGDWEKIAQSNAGDSYKDELWTIWMIIIMTLCFIEPMQPVLKEGFRFLREDLPEFLQWGILISISASFGIKGVSSFIGKK
ncbi:MAG: hypothetical protein GOVbin1230_4 [Prokaryotic dsDNA virus sp.]|jgi:hypothetical protein|nr:MAG: hypothetical protein GOVbin1230_4 [Prokaryotic dsDNA virus sp.]|tara:strand:+ start:517 stop:894 length:378 start_codon:yes stop_codon:yes gene_type:complete